jgi:excisionase family DNA binding protein
LPYGKTYSVKESAEYLGLSTKTIRRYLGSGMLKAKRVRGKYGDEIRIFKKSLDRIIGQKNRLSNGLDDLSELCKLYREATPEVREVVIKILKSTNGETEDGDRNGFLSSIFRRKGGDSR